MSVTSSWSPAQHSRCERGRRSSDSVASCRRFREVRAVQSQVTDIAVYRKELRSAPAKGHILLLMRSVVVLGAVVFAMPLLAQSVSAVNGNIVFTDNRGSTKLVTAGHSDSDPSLSFDGRQIVFVRHTANNKGVEAC